MEDTATPPPLLDNTRRLYFAQWAKGLQAGVSLLLLAALARQYYLIHQVELGARIDPGAATLNDWLVRIGVGLQLTLLILALVALIQWQLRAYQNVHRLPDARPRYGSNMAGWGWFIPILSFWVPYQVMADIGRYIGRFNSDGTGAVRTRWDVLLPVWWGLHICELVMDRLIWQAPDGETLPELLTSTQLQMGGQVVGLLTQLTLLGLLRQLVPAERNLLAAETTAPSPLPDAPAAEASPGEAAAV